MTYPDAGAYPGTVVLEHPLIKAKDNQLLCPSQYLKASDCSTQKLLLGTPSFIMVSYDNQLTNKSIYEESEATDRGEYH